MVDTMLRHHERIDKSINEANLRLRALRITIERRGDRFALRTILPPKPKSKQDKWTQQRISLDLRLDSEGVRFAEAKAREISGLLLANAFTWDAHIKHEPEDVEVVKKWGETVVAFSDWYRVKHDLKDKTWKNTHYEYLRCVPTDAPVSSEVLLQIVESIAPTSKRSRELAILALGNLAKFAEIEVNFDLYKVRRTLKDKKPRTIPSDQLILESAKLFKNPQWQCAYKLLACFGLRPHELQYIDLTEFPPVLNVTDGKTGSRRIYLSSARRPSVYRWDELQ